MVCRFFCVSVFRFIGFSVSWFVCFLGFLLLIGSIVFILLINKYENFGFANYDLGIFFNKIANIDQGYYSYIFHGHSNFYLLLFAALL